jgi:hypothetical protein
MNSTPLGYQRTIRAFNRGRGAGLGTSLLEVSDEPVRVPDRYHPLGHDHRWHRMPATWHPVSALVLRVIRCR